MNFSVALVFGTRHKIIYQRDATVCLERHSGETLSKLQEL